MNSLVEQDLSYILLIELLAHQFAYPVRWIETQEEILNVQNAQRIIEVGPSQTLINMMRQSAAPFTAREDALALRRQYLSVVRNEDEVYYEGMCDKTSTPIEEKSSGGPSSQESMSTSVSKSPKPQSRPETVQTSPPKATHSETIPNGASHTSTVLSDQQVSAKLILETIVTEKMARLGRKFMWNSTIKGLASGRSVIENEIIGDLMNEFENCPENISDMVLEALCESIQSRHNGRIGKVSRRLISRTLMSKLSRPWNLDRVREYLETRWNLKVGRQDTVLLMAARASFGMSNLSETESQALLDKAAMEHLTGSGVDVEDNGSTHHRPAIAMEPPTTVQSESKIRYTERSSHELGPGGTQDKFSSTVLELMTKVREQEQELQKLREEHDEIYLTGITGIFNARKARSFTSSWNWRREDQVRAHYDSRLSKLPRRTQERIRYPGKNMNQSDAHPADKAHNTQKCTNDNGRLDAGTEFHLETWRNNSWHYDKELSALFYAARWQTSFNSNQQRPKKVLLTGAGKDSIGQHLLEHLLRSGAHVVVGTSKLNASTAAVFQKLYRSSATPGSSLTILPFNQGSRVDIEALVIYIYENLGWDLDLVIPFAAISQNGQSIENIDGQNELAHRIMLTNTIRLLGCISRHKRRSGIETNPAQVLLPLSPNHGEIGHDGLYAESKLGLESLLRKWHAEDWHPYLSLCGAIIGWTRGTGLTKHQDALFDEFDEMASHGTSVLEMASSLFALTNASLVAVCDTQPILADFSGSGDCASELAQKLRVAREFKTERQDICRRLAQEAACDEKAKFGDGCIAMERKANLVGSRANFRIDFPSLPFFESLMAPFDASPRCEIPLERIVVIVGFGEVGPFGSSRTRWEMETSGDWSLDGTVELAWMMGFVECKEISTYQLEWVDCETSKPIADEEIRAKYLSRIIEGCGIRFLDPENQPRQLYEYTLSHDLPPFEVEADTAQEFKRQYADKIRISPILGSSKRSVQILQGADLLIPKPASGSRAVAGLIPQGWEARRYGIPPDVISEVDPATLSVLVCVAETLLSAGVTDFYEFYHFVQTSEIGNCLGSGLGGINSLGKMYRDQFQGESFGGGIQSDILQETFVNTAAAWVNMLLLGANGPMNTPVGACATSLESLDRGYDLISSGKAQVCLVGGYDDISREISMSFGRMKATVDVEKELASGREPREMSRPMTATRAGFVESHGCGMQLLTSASLAIEMGLPIRGVLAFAGTAADGIGRSVPRPGAGIASFAAEHSSKLSSHLSSPLGGSVPSQRVISYESPNVHLKHSFTTLPSEPKVATPPDSPHLLPFHHISRQDHWSKYNRLDLPPRQPTSALQRALSKFDLTANDIHVLCLHATSTPAGDANELEVLNRQLLALGHQPENSVPLLATCQKGLLGHSKGAAGAWAVNSSLQILSSGLVPGNPTIDDVDPAFENLDVNICFPAESVQTDGVPAVSVTGFGFGQKGAQVILVHPDRLWRMAIGSLARDGYEQYATKLRRRKRGGDRAFADAVYRGGMVKVKEKGPNEELEGQKESLH
ncbi:uncharacterized protein Z518_08254 [Rhinocladiella mackenziei CBS 650.93]|uniref:Ketosynthase family 3 (KS3) domain-containing protein n=1 Tax=Rhinocladiella mackenziei CBS 650.93 TaxID=1442369 RepID=A0A0D2GVL5_9EURO|nr:uncharacterized protein Z518_08254 [Rhinocladiella mackenziei CBS 650.93]KIX02313.1 hypothetical protein Z518_08254 [Rhinocladiella mackenziei CBS 650.93]